MIPRLNRLGLLLLLSGTGRYPVARSFTSTIAFATQRSPNTCSYTWKNNFHTSARKMMATSISFEEAADAVSTTMVIGKRSVLKEISLSEKLGSLDSETQEALMDAIDGTGASSTFVKKQKIVVGIIPEKDKISRNNHPWSVHSITDLVSSNLPKGQTSRVIFVGDDATEYRGALTSAVAKAFPIYSHKTTSKSRKDGSDEENTQKNARSIQISFWDDNGSPTTPNPEATKAALAAVDGVQLAASLVDMTPEELTTDAYSAKCRELAESLPGVTMSEIVGEELYKKGYGGIYGVGKAATCPPRLVIMEYTPPSGGQDDEKPVVLVGKAIVYDTGGLSLKPKVGMCGMKADMGGSAGVLGGFVSAVKGGYKKKLVLLICLAENAIGPTAFRNDDILKMYSGKTVEVNNCDAEGRLVLGDGVAHATKHYNPALVCTMATLTGAQLVTTGKKHAGLLANKPELEQQAVAAGLKSGDLVYPMLYAPELLMSEFNSKVADMKNSVKDRSNAQSSCAGHFIESHLEEDYEGLFGHFDMAGPATNSERGTGYGVGLVLSLLGMPGF